MLPDPGGAAEVVRHANSRATIRDVARTAGLSTGTVSRMLNNRPDVSRDARERVLAAIAQLGYRPSPSARALSKRSISAVGILMPDMAHHVFMLTAQAIEAVASRHGLAVMLGNSERNRSKELQFGDLMAQYAVSGVLMIGHSSRADREMARRLGATPALVVGRHSSYRTFPCVTIDQCAATKHAVEHLLDLGHRRIGAVRGDPAAEAGIERQRGYLEALRAAGIEPDPRLIAGGGFDLASSIAATHALLDAPSPPTAIFFPNDELALAGMRVIKNRGLRIPEDVSIVGFDDVPFAELADPPLTTIHTPAREEGMLASQMLIELIEKRGQVRDVILGAELVVRGSTAPPSGADVGVRTGTRGNGRHGVDVRA